MAVLNAMEEVLKRYEPVIGLEVHAQLRTKSKIFCDASTEFTPEQPNKNINAYCIGMPGMLPILNESVVQMAIRAGLALNCRINQTSIWSRKHYFYPDLSKGYQLSQYDQPICEHGRLIIDSGKNEEKQIGVTRIHMEEDAGKNTHVDGAPYTLVDYNRAGVPLLEIVSEPELHSAVDAASYLRALRSILMALDVCDGNMEEGSFRCDANVSLRPVGSKTLGTRCEVKNINSFRFVQQAINYEILRHAKILDNGQSIVQETRLFDSAKKETRSMRSKEDAHDYRYFPDPDLPPLVIPDDWIKAAKDSMPELPRDKKARYSKLGLSAEYAQTITEEAELSKFFDKTIAHAPRQESAVANFLLGDFLRELNDGNTGLSELKFSAEDLAKLVILKETDKISSSQQKKIFQKMWHDGTKVDELMKKEGEQMTDTNILGPIVDDVLQRHPQQVQQLKDGKEKVISFLMGQVMRETKGKAKPPLIQKLIREKVKEI